jgi:hypothetical protein
MPRREIVIYVGLAWLIIMGSGFDDWIYWHFFTITVSYNSSHIELLLSDVCLTNVLWRISDWLEFTNDLPFVTAREPSIDHHLQRFIYCSSWMRCFKNVHEPLSTKRIIPCLGPPIRLLGGVYRAVVWQWIISAFRPHVTIWKSGVIALPFLPPELDRAVNFTPWPL